ncbi:hypothetical protein H4R34_005211, partial [Dimargaris verticillata]
MPLTTRLGCRLWARTTRLTTIRQRAQPWLLNPGHGKALPMPDALRRCYVTPTADHLMPGGTPFIDMFDQMGITGGLRVQSYNSQSFTLTNGAVVRGPVFLVGNNAFGWQVPVAQSLSSKQSQQAFAKWTPEMFTMLSVVSPKPEILVVGTGKANRSIPKAMQDHIRSLGIQLEVTDT